MIFSLFSILFVLTSPFSHADETCTEELRSKWAKYVTDFNIYPEIVNKPIQLSERPCPADLQNALRTSPMTEDQREKIVKAINEYVSSPSEQEQVNAELLHITQNLTVDRFNSDVLNVISRHVGAVSGSDKAYQAKAAFEAVMYKSTLSLYLSIYPILQRQVILANTLFNIQKLRFKGISGQVPNFYDIAKNKLDPKTLPQINIDTSSGARPAPSPPRTLYRDSGDQANQICSKGALAHTSTVAAEEPNDLILCDAFFADTTTPIQRAAALIHEARHRMDGDPVHVPCTTGLYAAPGIKSPDDQCDQKLEEDFADNGSGFNAEVHFLSWVVERQIYTDTKPPIFDLTKALDLLKVTLNNRFAEPIGPSNKNYSHFAKYLNRNAIPSK